MNTTTNTAANWKARLAKRTESERIWIELGRHVESEYSAELRLFAVWSLTAFTRERIEIIGAGKTEYAAFADAYATLRGAL